MAEFKIEIVKDQYIGGIKTFVSLNGISADKDEETVVLPETYLGEDITHLGYSQAYEPAHEEWADWHHPGKGMTHVPERYSSHMQPLDVSPWVKKIVISKTVRTLSYDYRMGLDHITFEVDPENPYLTVEDGKVVPKRK